MPSDQLDQPTNETAEARTKLDRQIRHAYKWTALITSAKHAVTFAISMVLARLLSPADYGLAGMVFAVTAIVSGLQDVGMGQAVVYFRENDDDLPSFATVAAFIGALFTLVLIACSGLIADYYHEPQVKPILQWLSLNILLLGFRAVPQGVLQRQLRFQELNISDALGIVAGGVTAMVMAFHGYGVWSLVANGLLSTLITLICLMILVPPRFTLRLRWHALRKLFRWSLPVTGGVILWRFFDNVDYVIVGRVLGPVALGYYTLAFRFATLVHQKLSTVVNRVSFASLTAMKDNRKELAEHWFQITRSVSLLAFPLLLGFAIAARELITLLVGEKWLEAVDPLRLLCIMGLMRCILPLTNIVANAMGRTDLTFIASLFYALILPPAFYAGAITYGIVGVALAWSVVNPLVGGFVLRKVLQEAGKTLPEFFGTLYPATMVMLSVGAAMLLAIAVVPSPPGSLGRLATQTIAAALVMGLWLWRRPAFYSFLWEKK